MYGELRALQLGKENLAEVFQIPACVEWQYEKGNERESFMERQLEEGYLTYDVAIIGRNITEEEKEYLFHHVRAYGLFVLSGFEPELPLKWLMKSRVGRILEKEDLQNFLEDEIRCFFSNDYGEKCRLKYFAVSPQFYGDISYSGYRGIELQGDFGEEYRQIGFWRMNLPFFSGQALEFWLEYEKEREVELQLEITSFIKGSVNQVANRWIFTNQELCSQNLCIIENRGTDSHLFISLYAKGVGSLRIINLHDRWSRKGYGEILPGGKRRVISNREEAFFYFEPGDLKPPLNIYFAGYRTKEGFEGYGMLRSFGSPFLLISEQRLEGGGFYIGDEEYESCIREEIEERMKELGFSSKDVVMGGISMGSTGAMYYGAAINPKFLILGKPLANLGNIAEAERIERPGGFPTSIDMLKKYQNAKLPVEEAVVGLNAKFWNQFDKADWKKTVFVVSYMLEDDYDRAAYQVMLSHLHTVGTRIYGRGIHGRHNDNTPGIVKWFLTEYKKILRLAYQREV